MLMSPKKEAEKKEEEEEESGNDLTAEQLAAALGMEPDEEMRVVGLYGDIVPRDPKRLAGPPQLRQVWGRGTGRMGANGVYHLHVRRQRRRYVRSLRCNAYDPEGLRDPHIRIRKGDVCWRSIASSRLQGQAQDRCQLPCNDPFGHRRKPWLAP